MSFIKCELILFLICVTNMLVKQNKTQHPDFFLVTTNKQVFRPDMNLVISFCCEYNNRRGRAADFNA